jgi:hypothetical protein
MAIAYLVFREGGSYTTDELLRAFYDEQTANSYMRTMNEEAKILHKAQRLRDDHMCKWWMELQSKRITGSNDEKLYGEESKRFVSAIETLNDNQKARLLKLEWRACQQSYVQSIEVE